MADPFAGGIVRRLRQNPSHAAIPSDFWDDLPGVLSDSRAYYHLGYQAPRREDIESFAEEMVAEWHRQYDPPEATQQEGKSHE